MTLNNKLFSLIVQINLIKNSLNTADRFLVIYCIHIMIYLYNDDVMTWKLFPHYQPFMRGVQQSSSHWWILFRNWQLCGAGIILCVRIANERWRYNVTLSLIGWVNTQNDLWGVLIVSFVFSLKKLIHKHWFVMISDAMKLMPHHCYAHWINYISGLILDLCPANEWWH